MLWAGCIEIRIRATRQRAWEEIDKLVWSFLIFAHESFVGLIGQEHKIRKLKSFIPINPAIYG